jgi:hypothetical protein
VYENKQLIAKYAKEIAGILARAVGPTGFQYSLRASIDGLYPNVRGGTTPLKAGEVWKYGETTQGNARYSAKDLASIGPGVYLVPELIGNQIEIKIAEKSKIYTYVLTNFCLPPGNKIFR